MTSPMHVRDAEDDDLPAILAFYNQVIATSTAVYTSEPATLAERGAWLRERREQEYPVLVAELGGSYRRVVFRCWKIFALPSQAGFC